MRRVGGLLLVALVACAGLLGAASADAALPEYNGVQTFQDIRGPEGPEEFSWQVGLDEGQELRLVDDQHAEVLYSEEERLSFTISAIPAHDAIGTNVPTTLAITQPDILTLTVHHREGNPAAGGASFDYPVIAGAGWEGGFHATERTITPEESAVATHGASATATEPPKPERVFVTRALGEDKLFYRPHFFLLSGDGTFGVGKVQWQSYGGAVAKASGRAYANDCIPYCAAGHLYHPQAKLRLSKVVGCQGKSAYARLRYVLTGRLPEDFPRRGSLPMLPLGEDGKPDC